MDSTESQLSYFKEPAPHLPAHLDDHLPVVIEQSEYVTLQFHHHIAAENRKRTEKTLT
jgi:hypothetical protein